MEEDKGRFIETYLMGADAFGEKIFRTKFRRMTMTWITF